MPGILLANRPFAAESPALTDVTATIMDVFDIEKPQEMIGASIFK
jgi:bisphosphoglycerate-independent phosphoglycerate mutase (AlkP superfamily)